MGKSISYTDFFKKENTQRRQTQMTTTRWGFHVRGIVEKATVSGRKQTQWWPSTGWKGRFQGRGGRFGGVEMCYLLTAVMVPWLYVFIKTGILKGESYCMYIIP